MNPILVILLAKLRIARHSVASIRNESRLKVAVITVCTTLLWLGLFAGFYEAFLFMRRFGVDVMAQGGSIGNIILVRMMGVTLFAIFIMLLFSNTLVAFSTLYKSREVQYLLQSPMSFREFFHARFVEIVWFSSWALAYLGSPLILAYGVTNQSSVHVGTAGLQQIEHLSPMLFYLAVVLYFVPFIVMPAGLGGIVTLVLARVFPHLQRRTIVLLGVLAVCVLFLKWRVYFSAERLSEDTVLPVLLDATAQTQSPLLPTYWASKGLLAASVWNISDCLFYWLLLCSNALLIVWLAGELAQRLFYPGWSSIAGQDHTRIYLPGKGLLGRMERLLGFVPNPARALIMKDVKVFWRDAAQWSQFVIFFGIMAVYIANMRSMGGRYEQDFWRTWIACLNIGACTLILATLTSRFVFPLVSLEGRRFWIVGLAPLSFRGLVWQKYWLSVCTTIVVTVGLAVLSGRRTHLEPVYFGLTVYSVFVTNFGLTGLAVGLGSLYPNFHEDNPARIVSGLGGTLNLLLSVGYVACVVGSQTAILLCRSFGTFHSDQAFYAALAGVIVFVTVLSVMATLIPMRLGLRNLNDMEY